MPSSCALKATGVWPLVANNRRARVNLGRQNKPAEKGSKVEVTFNTSMKRNAASSADALAVGDTGHFYDRADQTKLGDRFFEDDDRPIILFDGVCNFCNGWVNFVLDNDKKGELRFASLQSESGKELLRRCGRDPNDLSSIVLVEKDDFHIKSEAVLRIANKMGGNLSYLSSFDDSWMYRFLRDSTYELVAANRYNLFGKTESCRLWPQAVRNRFLPN